MQAISSCSPPRHYFRANASVKGLFLGLAPTGRLVTSRHAEAPGTKLQIQRKLGQHERGENIAKARRSGKMIENDASRRYRGVSHMLARLFPRPDTVRATPDPVYPFIEPTYSPAHPPSATNVNPRFFSNSRHQFNKLQFSLSVFIAHCALRIAHTNSLVQTLNYILLLSILRPLRAIQCPTIHTTCYLDNPTLLWSHLLQPHNLGSTQRLVGSFRGGSS